MIRLSRLMALGGLALLMAPAYAAGQDAPPPPPQQQQQTELVFEREVFTYPAFQRRNPFRPLAVGDGGQVRFEQLRLGGILFSNVPGESVCVLSTAELTVAEDGSGVTVGEGESWYAKEGQTIGNVTVLEIHPDRVLVEVEEFGIAEQRTMQLQTRRLGGARNIGGNR